MYEKQLFGSPTDKTNPYEQPDSPMWNLYQVMTNILNDGRFIEYGGIVLCEYEISSDTHTLSGCPLGGAYFTCDGDVYYSDTKHTWHDEEYRKNNRWVAYLLLEEYTDINLIADLNPKIIHIGRKVGVIKSTIAANIQNIVCTDGNELKGINFGNKPSFGSDVVLRNIKEHKDGYIFYGSDTNSVYLEIDNITKNPFYNCKKLKQIVFNTKEYNVATLCSTSNAYGGDEYLTKLNKIFFPKGFEWKGTAKGYSGGNEIYGNLSPIVDSFHIYGITKISKGSIIHTTHNSLEFNALYAHDLEESTAGGLLAGNEMGNYTATKLEVIKMPKLRIGNPIGVMSAGKNRGTNLIDIEVGEMETNMSYGWWNPTNVLADADKTTQLLQNIHNHIAAKVKDVKGLEPLTITFSQGIRDILLPETESLFASKNWNIAPAKTVTE
jgi:hypothetical protein